MVDYGSGYFSGLKLGFILIVLGIEFYFFIFDRLIEKDASSSEILILSFLFILSIFIVVKKLSLISIFIPPIGYIFFHFLKEKKEDIITREMEERKLEELRKIIEKKPDNFTAYIELGDYYFKKENYDEAIKFYKKAYEIKDFPWIRKRIEIAEKENKIKKGMIWICRNCGEENRENDERCKNCGEERDVLKSIKKDLKETKRYFILLLLSPLIVLIVFLIIIYLPLYFSIFLYLLLLYFLLRFFIFSG